MVRRLSSEFGDFIESYPLKRTTIPYLDGIWTWIDCNPKNVEKITKIVSQESITDIEDITEDYYSRKTVKQLSIKDQDKLNKLNSASLKYNNNNNNEKYESNEFDIIVILHGLSGTAGEYFMFMKNMLKCGYRIISVQYPIYDDINDWIRSFSLFLDQLELDSIHLYGSDLGGYLSIMFSQEFPNRVKSLILCNAFVSTLNLPLPSIASTFLYFCPQFILVKLISEIFKNREILYSPIEDMGFYSTVTNIHKDNNLYDKLYNQSLNFVIGQLYSLSNHDLASRLSFVLSGDETLSILNLTKFSSILDNKRITFISSPDNSFDDHNFVNSIIKFENVKLAQLKYGGDFPHLSNPDDISLFCQVHLRNCNAKKYTYKSSNNDLVNNKQESPKKLTSLNSNFSPTTSSSFYEMPYPGNIIHHESSFDYNMIN
ncbi:hypothetical protein CPHLJ_4g4130 [Cryptosporidium parvum]|uniref:Maspardin n=1 Tax=Cryptosporidium parvum TaxID=5807 RepID=A0A7S7RGU8_CRYPV|nr:Maspardin/Alpha Beta hydrolase fold-containing protein [Cryptosporidium parvum]WKS77614.1 hypothetical protein CPCDC_4g4130 [Cryptosporidium sp. 43IA8]WRK31711.1 Maspardin/Alpha Beta hydrolase fold-containing protein [Cryptosporidium parvum]|eukprot:QOY42313.1 hypothetical protein CPATCC_001947 [Cryptosporidium parvum]